MDDSTAAGPPPARPDIGAGCLAMSIASAVLCLPIAIAIGWPWAWPFVLVVTLLVVTVLGTPAFALIRIGSRARWLKVCIGGFVTGAFFPALNLLPGSGPAPHDETLVNTAPQLSYWTENLLSTTAFGALGVVGALITWLLLGWFAAGRAAPLRLHVLRSAGLAALMAASLAGAMIYGRATTDQSCHVLRDTAQPPAMLQLRVAPSQWPALSSELERFARAHGWSLRADSWRDPSFRFFDASLCNQSGIRIDAFHIDGEDAHILFSAGQSHGGNGWQAPLRALQRQLEARWPGSVRYPDGPNASQRPPWAPPLPATSPSPTPTGGSR